MALPQSITIVVVAICGVAQLKRCLAALAAQEQAPTFEVVVSYDPDLGDISCLQAVYPHVRMVSQPGERAPVELAARGIHEAKGSFVFLTEDHCIPHPDWVRRLYDMLASAEYGAVGGVVETDPGVSPVDWAFYYVDFFRYCRPVPAGPTLSLTVCNVAYRRTTLDAIQAVWTASFHETTVNDAIHSRCGPLWLVPEAVVDMRRRVRLTDAIRERYAFGRLFACTRLDSVRLGRRLYYCMFAPVLPMLLLGRMVAKALTCRRTLRKLLQSSPIVIFLLLAWSWGEWLGYLTHRRPRSLEVAPESRKG